MLISPAYAQAAAPAAGGGDMFMSLLPLLLIFVVFYFLLIRPQQAKMKAHREMIDNLKRGDQIATSGGIVGKIVKVEPNDGMLTVEIAPNVQVRVIRSTVADVLNKPVPAPSNENRAATAFGAGSFLNKLLGKK
ncbi:preprotein translocase subunit YajC [Benzoatithermus flavus]|uniref:Sec translocon accessory complex subunit YajC n=1 Tax=Benzoatithermus flavus TaxID=3108223 RepID=A0ABU8XVM7_9PROT